MIASILVIGLVLAAGAPPVWEGVLPEKAFDFAKVRVLQTPTAGFRHAVLAGVDLPAHGVDVTLKCAYRRSGEGWGQCQVSDWREENPGIQSAAARLMSWTQIDMSGLTALRPVEFVTQVKVRISPADRIDLQPPPLDAGAYTKDIVWAPQPSADRIGREYPDRALRMGVGGWATVACRILEDLSPACVTVAVSEPDYGFETSAPRILGLRRVEARLADGRPAVGAWIRTTLRFNAP